ncbi:MAG TPA: Nif3-like dinuclear metal center hexameric protein [Mobilitalea sp.]|nr:Nif3-like dinuclear metal center hexameric protein [Mobilitalea sp.]
MTVKEVIDAMIKKTGLEAFPQAETCDRLMTGSYDMEVTKIVTTFMATVEVIQKAIDIGANFIITHEPTWFTGMDATEWLENDPVYVKKRKLIEENKITIWRFHDHMHMGNEDGIYRGFDLEFDWAKYKIQNSEDYKHFGVCYQIPVISLEELSRYFKEKLDMQVVRIVGNHKMKVERVGVLVGGGSLGLGVEELPMIIMHQNNLDLLICGEITEWTISAYVRDAAALGMNKGMLILGHERSEEVGMKHLGSWMKEITGDIEIQFIDAGEPFLYL